MASDQSFLICGMGNPGDEYKNTRHNLGFLAVDLLTVFLKTSASAKLLAEKKLLDAVVWEFSVEMLNHSLKIILAQPQTFMNNSGLPVKQLLKHYKLEPANLVVIHDDIDLPSGKLKISHNANSGGHKGVQSIIDQIKSKEFIRVRIGIKPKQQRLSTDEFVLKNFGREEKKNIDAALKKIHQLFLVLWQDGLAKAMSLFNV